MRDHLDADELSAYAENALPAAARARYTEHLAECSRCRELVVQLSSVSGVVPLLSTATRFTEPSGLRNFLASLFSPMVLRYAVPALGLIVVAAIGFVRSASKSALRGSSFTVQQQPPAASPVASPEQGLAGYSDRPAPSLLDTRDNQPSRGVTTQTERETQAKEQMLRRRRQTLHRL